MVELGTKLICLTFSEHYFLKDVQWRSNIKHAISEQPMKPMQLGTKMYFSFSIEVTNNPTMQLIESKSVNETKQMCSSTGLNNGVLLLG